MNLFTKQKVTHRHRNQTQGYQRGQWGGGGINQECGSNRYTQLYIKEIKEKKKRDKRTYCRTQRIMFNILYSNTYNGKEYESDIYK